MPQNKKRLSFAETAAVRIGWSLGIAIGVIICAVALALLVAVAVVVYGLVATFLRWGFDVNLPNPFDWLPAR